MKRLSVIFFFLLMAFLFSCTSQKKLIYFQGTLPQLNADSAFQLRIYPGDILSVNIFTINQEAYPYLSTPADKPASDNRSAYEKGIIVNNQGEIRLPLIGAVNVNGLTISEATSKVETTFKAYIQDPIVTIKKLNFKVTILGEVARPGTYQIANERITLPEALGMAGDLNAFANRQALRIIRHENGLTKDYKVDLTNAADMTAELFYIHPDDIIYVQPLPRRGFANISPSVTVITSILTTAVVVATLIITSTR